MSPGDSGANGAQASQAVSARAAPPTGGLARNGVRCGHRIALRPKEAAHALGVSERTLRQMLPELPIVRHGGVVLLPVGSLRAWLEKRARIATAQSDAMAEELIRSLEDDYE